MQYLAILIKCQCVHCPSHRPRLHQTLILTPDPVSTQKSWTLRLVVGFERHYGSHTRYKPTHSLLNLGTITALLSSLHQAIKPNHLPLLMHPSWFRSFWHMADMLLVPCLPRSCILSAFSARIALYRYHLLHLSRSAHPASTKETPAFPTLLGGCRVYSESTSHSIVKAALSISIS